MSGFFAGAILFLLLLPSSGLCEEGRIFTLWPLIDYRSSEEVDYTSLNLLGPLINWERKGDEREFALRPLVFRAWESEGEDGYGEYLFPVASSRDRENHSIFQGIRLLNYDFGSPEEGGENEFMLFPFLFYGKESEEAEGYSALFPVGGTIRGKFWRDEIRFALFPLYGWTRKGDTTTSNVLWPVFARIRGENEEGLKVWPLFGASEKEGVYRKRFYLWPVFFSYDLALNTDNPRHQRAAFPFYISMDSPERTTRTWIWPFFSHVEDRKKGYEEWNFPWPIFRIAHGEHKESSRMLPLFADERIGAYRKRWFLWPIYKIEELQTAELERRRHRVLYFLFSSTEEKTKVQPVRSSARVALWPFFTYERRQGVGHFHAFSLLEPFFPESGGIARNWAPLWRLYQVKWDKEGNEASTFLWNLYWKERRGESVAMELFPILYYRREEGNQKDVKFLKGLFRYHRSDDRRAVHLFYLPWGISWGD